MSGGFLASRAGCGGFTGGSGTSPTACSARPTWLGWAYFAYPRPGQLCLAFACDEHRDVLQVARPVKDDDRAEMERRRERTHRVIEDKQPFVKEPSVASGREARARLAGAITYAEAHVEDEGWWVNPAGESRVW